MPALEKATEVQQAYQRLREAILQGELLPGQRLVEKELSERFGLGRAAIRTALAKLEQDGLVESEPYRGAWVRVITEEEAVEILEARMALECLAVRHAARKATSEAITRLRQIHAQMEARFREGDLLGMSELNSLFHRTLVEISGHGAARRLIEALRAQGVRHQFRTVLVPGRSQRSLEEHRLILEAVAAHDEEAAERAMKAHLQGVIAALRQAKGGGV
ncbi:GntR family transcriptional regulator [Thermus sp.]|uniref:GntR family transcriptional regulator n=1 Tax=Thermus sp. TaxID=275 RepID=UPI0025EC9C96|nr:GntR family transcriptional regulator [Thermus sp.]MCS6867689.1 GntR family transcriptional regulator [Thermus sp.]MCX7849480.1 GntR family transcriptional regulator [Thermus sp.]MDW8017522.1 GntR family transcriptional regulator [Thermus sp.]MDW8357787.1 GntR family transcriptional regulator [Thermus sp.]